MFALLRLMPPPGNLLPITGFISPGLPVAVTVELEPMFLVIILPTSRDTETDKRRSLFPQEVHLEWLK